jgi:hypothetical protein
MPLGINLSAAHDVEPCLLLLHLQGQMRDHPSSFHRRLPHQLTGISGGVASRCRRPGRRGGEAAPSPASTPPAPTPGDLSAAILPTLLFHSFLLPPCAAPAPMEEIDKRRLMM